jgi:hypothetical protein
MSGDTSKLLLVEGVLYNQLLYVMYEYDFDVELVLCAIVVLFLYLDGRTSNIVVLIVTFRW